MLDLLYALSIVVALIYWLIMFLAPRRPFTDGFIHNYGGLLLVGAMYMLVMLGAVLSSIGQVTLDFRSPATLASMLSTPNFALAIWLHVIVADLAGCYWIYTESEKLDVPVSVLRFFLFFAFMLAPVGIFAFVLYRLLKNAARRAVLALPDEKAEPARP